MNLRNVIENIKSQDSRGKSSNRGKSSQNLHSSQGSVKITNAPRKINLKTKTELGLEDSPEVTKALQLSLPVTAKPKGGKNQQDLLAQARD